MSKFSAYSASHNPRRSLVVAPGASPGSGVTVTSGAAVARIDLTALLARPDPGEPARPPAVTGAVHAVPGPDRNARTVALSDGTRITFASAVTESAE